MQQTIFPASFRIQSARRISNGDKLKCSAKSNYRLLRRLLTFTYSFFYQVKYNLITLKWVRQLPLGFSIEQVEWICICVHQFFGSNPMEITHFWNGIVSFIRELFKHDPCVSGTFRGIVFAICTCFFFPTLSLAIFKKNSSGIFSRIINTPKRQRRE